MKDEEKSREQLAEIERRSHAWLENSPVCTKILDLDLNLLYMSRAGVNDLGIEDITVYYGKHYPFDIYPAPCCNELKELLLRVKKTKEVVTLETPVLDSKRNTVWYDATIVPVVDDEGSLEYIMIVSINITERKKIEEESSTRLHELEVFYESAVNREEKILELKQTIDELKEKIEVLEKKKI